MIPKHIGANTLELLGVLWRGPATISELGAVCTGSEGSLSVALRRMREDGFVRAFGDDHGSQFVWSLTDEGHDLRRAILITLGVSDSLTVGPKAPWARPPSNEAAS